MSASNASTSLAKRLETASRNGSTGSIMCFQECAAPVRAVSETGTETTLGSAANMCSKVKVALSLSQTPYLQGGLLLMQSHGSTYPNAAGLQTIPNVFEPGSLSLY